MDVSDLFAEEKAEIPEEYHDAFDRLVGRGCSPSGVVAAVQYIETEHSQTHIADEYGVSTVTIGNLYPAVLAFMPEKELTVGNGGNFGHTKLTIAEIVGEEFGWDEGVQWTRNERPEGVADQPRLRKAGWEWLYRKAPDGWDDDAE